jgi:serine/threonine protein kinase
MLQETLNTILSTDTKPALTDQQIDYASILEKKRIDFKAIGYHYQVGEITKVQGWILHISVVRWQIPELLDMILPGLLNSKVAFKIIQDKETARNLLDGALGAYQVGKVISVYPETDDLASFLAEYLIASTKRFKGPAIPTDYHLGACLYTRYGAFSPVVQSTEEGKEEKFIYDLEGRLVQDIYAIPFSMPTGLQWPFETITPLTCSPNKKTLKGIYKPIRLLKSDSKGHVIKALFLKKTILLNWCVIKEGKANMWSDEYNRDIRDRLSWQKELHEELAGLIHLPKIIDLFYEKEDAYLVMEYIRGEALLDKIFENNKNCMRWADLPRYNKLKVLGYLLQALHIIENFHSIRIVHRDITPVNFLVTKNDRLVVIDIELAYSMKKQTPLPPFEAGTYGFMSPEQVAVDTPTEMQDIYAIGAFMITALTGLSPLEFNRFSDESFFQGIDLILENEELSQLIVACLQADPQKRPQLSRIIQILTNYNDKVNASKFKPASDQQQELKPERLQSIIQNGIDGLVSSPMAILNDLWRSRISDGLAVRGKETTVFSKSGGFYEGVTGTLYFLGRAKLAGYSIEACRKAYERAWQYLNKYYLAELPAVNPGLYGGSAGIALALATAIKAGILADSTENRDLIRSCLEVENPALDLASGIAGQMIALFQCREYLDPKSFNGLLSSYVNLIQSHQQKNGYWITVQNQQKKSNYALSFSYGNTGILWAFLENYNFSKDKALLGPIHLSLKALHKCSKKINNRLKKEGCRKIQDIDPAIFDGVQGFVLVCIKAYQVLKDPSFQILAEELLSKYHSTIVHDNLSQATGLAGLAELYLEAYQAFGTPIWKTRALWIANLLTVTCHTELNGTCHWLGNNYRYPTADFMVGSSGVIHALMRILNSANIGYRILHPIAMPATSKLKI